MELVYLWVQKYKNIKEQGFNFSPRFECEYKDGELTITPKEHIENFFDEKGKINITAIVGENGSGKSNLLELLFHHKSPNKSSKERFYIIKTKDGLFLYYFRLTKLQLVKKLTLKQKYTISKIRKEAKKTSSSQYGFSAIYFSNIYQSLPVIDRQDKKFYNITTSYLIDKYSKETANKEIISYKWAYSVYLSKCIESALIMLGNSNLELPFDKPIKLNIVLSSSYIDENIKGIELLYSNSDDLTFSEIAKRNIVYNYYNDLEKNDKKPFSREVKNFSTNYIEKTYQLVKNHISLDSQIDDFLDIINGDKAKENLITIDIENLDKDFINTLEKVNKLFTTVIDIFDFNWSPNLSTGEEAFLFQFANFYNVVKDNKQEDIMILIDEGETTMHPNWQKKYIDYLITFFKSNFEDKKFNIILTSHSPFLLSDLPKENIIFLKDGKNHKGVEHKQTFGANIHILLSDGFFMEGGLMGEFAKGKIEEIVKFYNEVKSSKKLLKEYQEEYKKLKDKFHFVHKQIGEEYLKGIIGNHIDFIEEKLKDDNFKEKQKKQLLDNLKSLGYNKDELIRELKNG